MKHLLLAFCLLSLAACSISNGENKGTPAQAAPADPAKNGSGSATGVDSSQPLKNETNYSICGGANARTSLDGSWQMQQSQGEFTFLMTLTFRGGNNVTLNNECRVRGRSLSSQVSSPAFYQNGRINVYSEQTHTEKIDEGGFHMDCTATIARGSMTYTFNGDCLIMRGDDGSEVMLTPAVHP